MIYRRKPVERFIQHAPLLRLQSLIVLGIRDTAINKTKKGKVCALMEPTLDRGSLAADRAHACVGKVM